MRWGSKTFRSTREAAPVRIVGDAAIATGASNEGRLVPLLILDALQRPDIGELIRVHQALGPGDVEVSWGQRQGRKGTVTLFLDFHRPVAVSAVLEFDVDRQGGLVDLIVRSRSVYLQAGRDGDRFVTTPDAPRILVEVPDTQFGPVWEKLALRELTRTFRSRGLSRSRARDAARQFLKEWRSFSDIRMPR